MKFSLAGVLLLGIVGCTDPPAGAVEDAAPRPVDAAAEDAARVDAGPMDAGPMDAAPGDAAALDAAPGDASPLDAAPGDASPLDAALVDASPLDATPVDAAPPDAAPDLGPRCGDGIVQDGEVCDEGFVNGRYDACKADCSGYGPFCGDGVVDAEHGEICDDGVNDALGGGCLPGCADADRSDAVFDRDLMRIEIQMAPADWDAMRHQRKTRHSIFAGADCRTRQVPNPYTWFEGSVRIDGEVVERVGLRKKGHLGSLASLKPSMKLRFDHLDEDQRFHTLKRFALNNAKNDPSYMRSCLAYRVFAAAGIPAPRCTFARVHVNGVDKGLYFAVEEIKKPFLRRHLRRDDGTLYEGTACDFRPEFFGGFEQETNLDVDPSRADLQRVYDVVQGAPDAELEARLDAVINLERFYRFWAAESLVWHRDGYSGNANNYFMYADPADGGRFMWIPWGPDAAMQADNRANVPDSVLAVGAITHRLYQHPPTRDRYYRVLLEVLDQAWDVEALTAEATRVEDLLRPELPEGQRQAFSSQANAIRRMIRERRGIIEAILAEGQPAWVTGMRGLPCRVEVAPIAGTLETTWGTLAQNIWESGSGSLDLVLDGQPTEAARAGARIGRLGDGRGQAQLTVETPDRRRLRLVITFTDPRFHDPYETLGEHPLIAPQMTTTVIYEDISGASPRRLGDFDIGEGTWTFDAVGTNPGDPVRVRFQGTLYRGV